jgi:hypothetical protein
MPHSGIDLHRPIGEKFSVPPKYFAFFVLSQGSYPPMGLCSTHEPPGTAAAGGNNQKLANQNISREAPDVLLPM